MSEIEVLDRRDLRRILRVSDRQVTRIIRSEGFPAPVFGSRWLKAAVLDWMVQRSQANSRQNQPSGANDGLSDCCDQADR